MDIPYHILPLDEQLRVAYQQKLNNLIKPQGALGYLEQVALQVALIQQRDSPVLRHPCNLMLVADHGILAEGVSISPREVTTQMTYRALKGDSGIGYLCRQHGFELKVIDVGVDDHFGDLGPHFYDRKIRRGTRNYLHESAMTAQEMEQALAVGREMVGLCHAEGSNVVSFGELGMGNTSAAALWMHYLTHRPLEECVGYGSDASGHIVPHKLRVLQGCRARYHGPEGVREIMQEFGGYEMVAAVGGMLAAAAQRMVILVDGFIMTVCLYAASLLAPHVVQYCIFGHQGAEHGHQTLLRQLGVRVLLQLDLRLGEGTGAVCAYPLVDSAVRMLSEMGQFQEAKVTKYF